MIILVLHESVQRTVDGVILAGIDLNRNRDQTVIIVDQAIDFAFVAVMDRAYFHDVRTGNEGVAMSAGAPISRYFLKRFMTFSCAAASRLSPSRNPSTKLLTSRLF